MLGLLIGTDGGLLELIPGDEPRQGFASGTVVSIDYRDGVALAAVPQAGAWMHDGQAWRLVWEGQARSVRVAPDGALFVGAEPAALAVSRDGGEIWDEITGVANVVGHGHTTHAPPGHDAPYVAGVIFPPDGILVGIAGAGAWFTRDGGINWIRRADGLDVDMRRLWEHPERPDRLYASAISGFYRSEDGGFSWVQSLAGLDRSRAGDAAVLPGTPDRLLLACARRAGDQDGALFASANAGISWQRIYLNEADEFAAFEHAPLVSRVWDSIDTVFTLADGTLFGSHDAGRTWIVLAEQLPRAYALAAAL